MADDKNHGTQQQLLWSDELQSGRFTSMMSVYRKQQRILEAYCGFAN